MKHRPFVVTFVAIACLLVAGVSEAGLKDYVRLLNDTYAFRIDSTVPFGSGTVFFVDMTSQTFPKFDWRTLEDGTFEVTWGHPEGAAALWQAQSPNRDFRRAQWTSTPLAGPQKVQVNIAAPEQGWTAYYVQVTFPMMVEGRTVRYPLSTLMQVVPDAYPAH